LRSALIASMLLFAAGGLIGVFISGNNVKIPAHYHGSIVGVTLALMGWFTCCCPGSVTRAGRAPRHPAAGAVWRRAVVAHHRAGLVWRIWRPRKVAGAEQVLRSTSEIAGMGLMGLGGLVAIIGGLMFVMVVWKALRPAAGGSRGRRGRPQDDRGRASRAAMAVHAHRGAVQPGLRRSPESLLPPWIDLLLPVLDRRRKRPVLYAFFDTGVSQAYARWRR